MASIDERVVRMKFDNKQFQQGVNTTMSLLDRFKSKMNFGESKQNVDELKGSFDGFSTNPMIAQIQRISPAMLTMSQVAGNALTGLLNKVTSIGKNIYDQTIGQVVSGGLNRAMNIEQAEFMLEGLGMNVEAAMASANDAVTGTAYGLDAAAKAAAQFGASGMEAGDEMTSALRGIAGVAAMTSSEYDDIANVFTTVSGNGRLMSDQLNQIASRGINAAAALAEEFDKTEEEIREMTSAGEIDFEMFYQAMDNAFGEHAMKANETYTGSLSNMRSALGRIGADVQAQKLQSLRDVFNSLTPVINDVRSGLEPLIGLINELIRGSASNLTGFLDGIDLTGFRTSMILLAQAIRNVRDFLAPIGGLVSEAFGNVFPTSLMTHLVNFTSGLKNLTEGLSISGENAERLRRTFEGVFAIFSIAGQIISGIVSVILDLVGATSSGAGGFLEITATIGDFLSWVDRALKEGELLTGFFDVLGAVIRTPIQAIGKFIDLLGSLFGVTGEAIGGVEGAGSAISNFGERVREAFGAVRDFIQPGLEFIQNAFTGLVDRLWEVFSGFNFENLLKGLTAGGLAALAINIRNFIKDAGGLKNLFKDGLDLSFGLDMGKGGLVDSIKDTFGALTETLGLMQTEIKADILIKIAIAVGILTASVVALSLIDPGKLTQALVGIGVMMTQLGAALAVLEKIQISDPTKLPILAASMILLATALLLMSAAVRSFATLDWDELAKGLVGIGVSLGLLVAATNLMPDGKRMFGLSVGLVALSAALLVMAQAVKSMAELDWVDMARGLVGIGVSLGLLVAATKLMDPKGMVGAGVGLIAISTALLILSSAVKSMASLGWEDMARGLVGIGGALGAIVIAMKLMDPKGLIRAGIGLAAFGGGLQVIAAAMQSMASMSWEEIGKGLAGIAGSLILIAGAMHIMPKNLIALGAGLVLVSAGVYTIAEALSKMSDIEPGQMATAVIGLGGALVVLAGGLKLMQGSIGGSAALLVASMALGALAPVLIMLGNTPWQVIAGGLAALAAAFAVMGVAGYLLAPVVVPLLAVAGAMTLFSVAALVAGTALAVFASALGVLAGPASAGLEVLSGMLALIPEALGKLAEGFLVMIGVIVENIGMLAESIGIVVAALMGTILEVIIDLIPLFAEAFVTLGSAILDVVLELLPKFMEVVTEILTSVMDLLEEFLPRIIDLIVNLLVQIVQGIAEAAPEVGSAFLTLIMAILDVIATGVPMIAAKALEMIVAFLNVIRDNIGNVVQAAVEVILAFVEGILQQIPVVVDAGFQMIIDLVNGIADAIRNNSETLGAAAADLGLAIIEGLLSAIAGAAGRVWTAITGVVGSAIEGAKNLLGINSPSKVFMGIGNDLIDGFVIGVDDNASDASDATGKMAQGVIKSAEDELDINSPSGVFEDIGENVNEGMAKGIRDSEGRPVGALEDTLDSMIGTTDRKTRELEGSTGSFYDTLLGQFNNNPATKRLEELANHARAAHATAVKENKMAEEEREYQAKEEKRQVYESVEEAKRNLREAREESAEASREARETESDSKKLADEEVKHKRDVEAEKNKITEAERRLQDAERQRDIYEYRMHGEEAGVAFVDGVAEGMIESKDEIPTVAEILSGLLLAEVDYMKSQVEDAFGIFDGLVGVRDTAKTITDHVRELERALNRMANTTNDNSFRRNRDMVIDSILAIGSELIGLISVIQIFEPYLPQLLEMFESSLGGIIPLVAQFAPELAATLGGGLAAALPAIAGPAGAIIAAVAGIWLVLKDSAENQYILNFLEHIVSGIGPFLASIPGRLEGFINTMVTGLLNVLDRLPEIIVTLIHGIVDGLVAFITGLPEVLPVLLEGIITALIAIIEALPEIVIAISTALIEAFFKAVPLLIEFVIFRLPPLLLELAFAIVNGLVNALGSVVEGALSLLLLPFQLIVQAIGGVFSGVDYLITGRSLIGDLLDGFLEGIANLKDGIVRPFKSIFEFIKSLLPWNIFHTLGLDVLDGLFWGMVDGIVSLVEKIFAPFRWLIDGIKDIFGIRSPSRVMMEIGGDVMDGFSKGITDGAEDSRLDIRKAIEDLLKDLEDGPDGTIRITPVIDLTEVEEGLSGLSGGVNLSASDGYAATQSISDIQSQNARRGDVAGDVTYIEYTQNNTSPEPLRAIDIYRNTQRQLDLMK